MDNHKQPPEVFCKKRCSWKFRKIRSKTSVPESLCLSKKRLWHKCFTVNFAKFLRTPFLQNTSGRLLPNREQLVSLNGYTSNLANFKYGVPQGSMLGPLLFLIYIHDFHLAIKYSEVHHLADDTNLLNFNSSLNPINKQVNHDLKT